MALNALDVALIAIIVLAVLDGVRTGLVLRAATLVGVVIGLLAAARVVPLVTGLPLAVVRGAGVFVGVFALGTIVSITTALAQGVGHRVRSVVARGPLGTLDRSLGAVAGALTVALVCWVALPTAADVPGVVSRQVRGSAVLGVIDATTPTPPDTLRGLRSLLGDTRDPEVFASLAPSPDVGPPPESLSVASSVVERAEASTVNVEVVGCGRLYEGSGVTLAPGTVVTNAHVVAGADTVEVRLPDGTTRVATVVVHDEVRDLAVLLVEDHPQAPLDLGEPTVGADAIVVGHPGGQDLARVAPARIERRTSAIGRDVYGRTTAERQVLFLAARLRPGDSGAPVIGADGTVVGIVFAVSPDVDTTAYALDVVEVRAALAAPRRPGEVGDCL